MAALRDRQTAVDAAVSQLTNFVLPIRTWIKLEETKGLDMSVRDGAPKSAAVRFVCVFGGCVYVFMYARVRLSVRAPFSPGRSNRVRVFMYISSMYQGRRPT